MDKWRKFVPGEFIPSLVGLVCGVISSFNGSITNGILIALVGLLTHLILLGYRVISGIILLLVTFSDAAEALPKLHDLLRGILQPGQPNPSKR